MDQYLAFKHSGRQIYDFHRNLTAALVLTDIEKISLSKIDMPSSSFYFHFGDVDWPSGYPSDLEGVLIRPCVEDGRKALFIAPISKWKYTMPVHMTDPSSIDGSEFKIDLNLAGDDLDSYLKEVWEDESELMGGMYYHDSLGVKRNLGFDPVSPNIRASILRVVVNCLLFLSAVKDDIVEAWDDRAPKELAMRAISADKDGARKTAERTLQNQDYIKVKLVGTKYAHAQEAHEHTAHGKAPHIRRGHFRNQAYGKEWAMHRVVFIPPMVINHDAGDIPGRIFQV
ncbi:hypothetical protein ACYPKM_04545 [Pseudomonas aeruginosa]